MGVNWRTFGAAHAGARQIGAEEACVALVFGSCTSSSMETTVPLARRHWRGSREGEILALAVHVIGTPAADRPPAAPPAGC